MKFEKGEIAKQRMKIIRFYERHGEKTTVEVFGIDRRTINRWRKRLKENNGKVVALAPLPKRPKRVRKSIIPVEVTEFIRTIRLQHPRLGKEKIKPLLDRYCSENGIRSISESTIGNIIRRHNFFFHKPDKQEKYFVKNVQRENKVAE
ncbi:MAG: helix-turn-helix domain-containing protein [Thermodesulfovibrionales bacterium]